MKRSLPEHLSRLSQGHEEATLALDAPALKRKPRKMKLQLTSEDAKNWATVVAIIVGGIWAFFEWQTVFPKTTSDNEISSASLRARTTGSISVSLIPVPSGEQATNSVGQSLYDLCAIEGTLSAQMSIPVRIALVLQSSAPVAVRVQATDFLLSEILQQEPVISDATQPTAFTSNSLGPVTSVPLDPSSFIGELDWTHVEPGGYGSLGIAGTAHLPFSCTYGGSDLTPAEFAFGLKVRVSSVGATGNIGESVDRYFFQTCKVNPDGGSTCSPDSTNEAGETSNSGFRVMAQ
jgi:hypothetical protein